MCVTPSTLVLTLDVLVSLCYPTTAVFILESKFNKIAIQGNNPDGKLIKRPLT